MQNWYYATFADILSDIERGLKALIVDRPREASLLWDMVDHHFGWTAGAGSSTKISGKRTRPLLTLLVARSLAGHYDHALPAALGIEVIHNFTLIHDDVMDRSDERRNRPTVWSKWGTAQAINAGDGLYSVGMSAVLDLVRRNVPALKAIDAMALVLDACLQTVEGQIMDIEFEQQFDVTPEDYIQMVGLKSGALIESSARMGALLSTDDASIVEEFGAFGRNLGIAFQIWDDYLGIWGQAALTGKSTTSDIEDKKKSYPVLMAFQRADAARRRDLMTVYQKDVLQPTDVSVVVDILAEVDAQQHTRDMIDTYYQAALTALDRIPVKNADFDRLRELSAFLIDRSY